MYTPRPKSALRITKQFPLRAMHRRRDLEVDGEFVKNSWIDSADSVDGGVSWRFLGKVAATHPPDVSDLEDAGYIHQAYGKTDYLSGRHSLHNRISSWTRASRQQPPDFEFFHGE